MSELHVVFGTSGSGYAIIRELVARGKHVRAVNRSGKADVPPEVELVQADATDIASVRSVSKDASVMYDCVNVPYPDWYTALPKVMNAMIEGANLSGAKLVYIDNVYGYGTVHGPMTEDTPYHATTRKGKLRAQLAQQLMAAHQSGKVRATIGRGSDFYGPGVTSALIGEKELAAMLRGKRLLWPARLNVPFTMTYTLDFAKGIATLGERDEALGQVWHIPTAPPLTGKQFLLTTFQEAKLPLKIGVLNRPMLLMAQFFNPVAREFLEMLYEYEEPYLFDSTRYQQAFHNFEPTSIAEGLNHTLTWVRSRM